MFGFYQRRIDREILLIGNGHLAALVAEPDRDRGGKDPLPRDAPVPFHLFHPVLHPAEHVFGIPCDLVGGFLDLVGFDPDEPLPLGEDLDRCLAPPAGADALGQFLLSLQDVLRLHIREDRGSAFRRVQPFVFPGDVGHPARAVDRFPEGEVVLFPPVDILLVAEGTDHHCAGPKRRVDGFVLHDRDGMAEERDFHCPSLEFVVPFIGRVNCDGYAGREKFRAGRCDLDAIEIEIVELRLAVFVRDFCKCDRRFAPGAVVHRVFALVDVAGSEHAQERELGLAVVLRHHGDVFIGPVGGERHLAQGLAHLPDVLLGKFPAHPPELFPGDIVFRDMVEFLDFDFGGEAVAVPPLREHHVVSFHPLIAGKKIDIAPVQRIADMEIAGRVGRGGIDNKLRLFRVLVKIVILIAPDTPPALFHLGKIIILGQLIRWYHSADVW